MRKHRDAFPAHLKIPPGWRKGTSYSDWRFLFALWYQKARNDLSDETICLSIVNGDVLKGQALKVVSGLSANQLKDVLEVIKALDVEFEWTQAGEGWLRWRLFLNHQRASSESMDSHLIEHDARYDKLKAAMFPNNVDLPSELRAIILMESAGLSDERMENLMLGINPDGSPPNYQQMRVKLKRLYGRESRSGQRSSKASKGGDPTERAYVGEESKDQDQVYDAGGTPAVAAAAEGEPKQEQYWEDEDGVQRFKDKAEKVYVMVSGSQGRKKWVQEAGSSAPGKGGYGKSGKKGCFNCGAPDHFARDCPEPDRREQANVAKAQREERSGTRR